MENNIQTKAVSKENATYDLLWFLALDSRSHWGGWDLEGHCTFPHIDGVKLIINDSVMSLEVILHPALLLGKQAWKMVPYLHSAAPATGWIHATITSNLEYCTAFPTDTTLEVGLETPVGRECWGLVINRSWMGICISSILQSLHWLLIIYWVQFRESVQSHAGPPLLLCSAVSVLFLCSGLFADPEQARSTTTHMHAFSVVTPPPHLAECPEWGGWEGSQAPVFLNVQEDFSIKLIGL